MPGTTEDYMRRLQKDGHHDLLEKIKAGEMSVYAACMQAGYRKGRNGRSRSQQIAHHWTRADEAEKRRFLVKNWASVRPLIGNLIKQNLAKTKAQKPTD